jgi:hypothetical protein
VSDKRSVKKNFINLAIFKSQKSGGQRDPGENKAGASSDFVKKEKTGERTSLLSRKSLKFGVLAPGY